MARVLEKLQRLHPSHVQRGCVAARHPGCGDDTRSEIEAVDNLAATIGVDLALEAKTRGEIAHLPIGRRVDREHALDAPLARHLNQVTHEQVAKALALPLIADHNGAPSSLMQKRLTPISLFSPASWRSAMNAMSRR